MYLFEANNFISFANLQEMAEKVTSSLLESLALDCPQPSVRYFMEWVVMKNLLKFPNLHSNFFEVIPKKVSFKNMCILNNLPNAALESEYSISKT